MNQKINIIPAHSFSKALDDFNCGKKPFFEVDGASIMISFFDTKPIEGYEPPVNAETREKLPYCCDTHKHILKIAQDWFDSFPNCCEPHKNLLHVSWFKKENYKELPLKVVNQLSYTTYHIQKQLDIPEWYKDITDYIEYNYQSFGQLPSGYGSPVGLHIYLSQLKHWIQWRKDEFTDKIHIDKMTRLEEFVETLLSPPKFIPAKNTDLNILHATYQRWLKMFPFGISYFSKAKQNFSNRLPFLAEPPVLNKYLGLGKAKLQSQIGLIETLTKLTSKLLQHINTGELLANGLITDKNKHSIELANANHQLKQNSLLTKFSKGEMRYVKVLKAWLANEKEHFKEILPMINNTGNNSGAMQDNDRVLNRDEYFQIIMEIYNLHRNTVGEFLAAKIKKHLPANPQFIECLYKDIDKIMEGVHRPGDLDLDLSSGDFEIEYGDIKLIGKETILDDAQIFLWMELLKLYEQKWGVLKLSEHVKAYETNILQRDDYTPAYLKKIAELNKELKKANGSTENESKYDNGEKKKGGANKRYALYLESYKQYANIENLPHSEAVKKTCNQYGISEKTLMRALKPQ